MKLLDVILPYMYVADNTLFPGGLHVSDINLLALWRLTVALEDQKHKS